MWILFVILPSTVGRDFALLTRTFVEGQPAFALLARGAFKLVRLATSSATLSAAIFGRPSASFQGASAPIDCRHFGFGTCLPDIGPYESVDGLYTLE